MQQNILSKLIEYNSKKNSLTLSNSGIGLICGNLLSDFTSEFPVLDNITELEISLNISPNNLVTILNHVPNLKTLNLSSCKINNVDCGVVLNTLQYLTELQLQTDVNDNYSQLFASLIFSKAINLQRLEIHSYLINNLEWFKLSLPELRYLALSDSREHVNQNRLKDVFIACPKLQTLNLKCITIANANYDLQNFPILTLTSLNLRLCTISFNYFKKLLEQSPNLQTLEIDLDSQKFTNKIDNVLLNLKSLTINNPKESFFESIILNSKNLEEIYFSNIFNWYISPKSLPVILSHCSHSLKILDLPKFAAKIGDNFNFGFTLPKLKRLNLSFCKFTENQFIQLLSLMPNLEELYLNKTEVPNLINILSSLKLNYLKTLELNFQEIDVQTLKKLVRNLPLLINLKLYGCIINGPLSILFKAIQTKNLKNVLFTIQNFDSRYSEICTELQKQTTAEYSKIPLTLNSDLFYLNERLNRNVIKDIEARVQNQHDMVNMHAILRVMLRSHGCKVGETINATNSLRLLTYIPISTILDFLVPPTMRKQVEYDSRIYSRYPNNPKMYEDEVLQLTAPKMHKPK